MGLTVSGWLAFILCSSPEALAQSPPEIDWTALQTAIATDGSLSSAPTLIQGDGGGVFEISDSLGERAGDNLFHSFEYFDLGAAETARFVGAPASNVISRITGGAVSRIAGRLESEIYDSQGSGANFYFLNPAGILIGPSGHFDLPASFVLSSANRLVFAQGSLASLNQPLSTLGSPCCLGEPIALEFDGGSPAWISFEGQGSDTQANSIYQWGDGGTVQLAAPDIRISGANLQVNGGTLHFSAVGQLQTSIPLALAANPSPPEATTAAGTIEVLEASGLFTLGTGTRNGRVVLRGGRLVLAGRARIRSGGNGVDAAIDLGASESIEIRGRSQIVDYGAPPASAEEVDGMLLSAPRIEISGQSSLTSGSTADKEAGQIRIVADRFDLGIAGSSPDRSTILSKTLDAREGGTIRIEVGSLNLTGGTAIRSEASRNATAPGPEILVEADTISLLGESGIFAATGTSSQGGNLSLVVTSSLDLGDGSVLETSPSGSGDAGSISLEAGSLSLVGGSQILSQTDGEGRPGDISLRVAGEMIVSGVKEFESGEVAQSGILARALNGAPASVVAGSIDVEAGSLEISRGGLVSVRAFGLAGAGDIDIDAGSSLRVSGREVSRSSEISARGVQGGSGDIRIRATEVEVLEGAAVSAATTGWGDAGDVVITADRLRVTGHSMPDGAAPPEPSAIYAESSSVLDDAGAAGSLVLRLAEDLSVGDSGKLSVRTRGGGSAGVLDVEAGSISIYNEALLISESTSATGGAGAAGSIALSATGNLDIRSGGHLRATARNVNAGDIHLDAGGTVTLVDALVTTDSDLKLGGNIFIDAGAMIESVRSGIETDVGGLGNGGNISIGQGTPARPRPPRYAVLTESWVTATAEQGVGGFIKIAGAQYLRSAGSRVDASSELGEDGTVEVTAPEVRVGGNLVALETSYLDAQSLLAKPCAARLQTDRSSLTVEGRPGVAPDPGGMLPSPILDEDFEFGTTTAETPEPLATQSRWGDPGPHLPGEIQGWAVGFLPGFQPSSRCWVGLR